MNTVRPFPPVPTEKGRQLFTSDLSSVSSSRLAALSNTLYVKLDTFAPNPRAQDRYDDLIQELESRSGPFTDRGNDVQSS